VPMQRQYTHLRLTADHMFSIKTSTTSYISQ